MGERYLPDTQNTAQDQQPEAVYDENDISYFTEQGRSIDEAKAILKRMGERMYLAEQFSDESP